MKPQLVLTSINTEHLTYENREHEAKGITKPEMKTKRHGNLDLSITPVGFGAWANCGSGWEFGSGEQDDKTSVAAIDRALELGVNWIDTAAVYGMGHSEEIVASALRTWPWTSATHFHQPESVTAARRKV
jgi:Aldo/keto reductase family